MRGYKDFFLIRIWDAQKYDTGEAGDEIYSWDIPITPNIGDSIEIDGAERKIRKIEKIFKPRFGLIDVKVWF